MVNGCISDQIESGIHSYITILFKKFRFLILNAGMCEIIECLDAR